MLSTGNRRRQSHRWMPLVSKRRYSTRAEVDMVGRLAGVHVIHEVIALAASVQPRADHRASASAHRGRLLAIMRGRNRTGMGRPRDAFCSGLFNFGKRRTRKTVPRAVCNSMTQIIGERPRKFLRIHPPAARRRANIVLAALAQLDLGYAGHVMDTCALPDPA